MKLVVDTHHLLIENAGTKRVTVNLLKELRKMDDIELIELKPSYALVRGKSVLSKILGHLFRFFWVHIQLPVLCLIKRVDVLLSPEFNTPLFVTCKRVVIAHDAHMRAQREFTNSLWFRFYYIPFIEYPIRTADLILTVSNFAKKQVVELMHVDEAKVYVVYLGVDYSFFKESSAAKQKNDIVAQGLVENEYILFVGTFEARKNIERLLEAFSIIKKKYKTDLNYMKLAIVGKPASGMFSNRSEQIETLINDLNLQNDVVMCGYLSDDALPNLYRGAKIVAFPSLQEGFGLPIIEGFSTMVPVLTSNACSMPEIAGDAAVLIDPYNLTDIANKLDELLFDVSLREKLIAAGKKRVEEFTWKRFADKIMFEIKLLK